MYCEPGVAGVLLGGRPSNERCEGVRGMSERSSLMYRRRISGASDMRMLSKRRRRKARRV